MGSPKRRETEDHEREGPWRRERGDLSPATGTDFVPNGSLAGMPRRREPLDATQKMIILDGVAEGMRYLHDAISLVNRDLKPDNVLIDANDHPVIGDFGLSKAMTESLVQQSMIAGAQFAWVRKCFKTGRAQRLTFETMSGYLCVQSASQLQCGSTGVPGYSASG